MAIVPLRFNERMVYQQGRALQVLSLAGIAGERPSVNSSEQITWRWIADCGFRYDERNRSIGVKGASRQSADLGFRRDANNQTDDGGSDSPILKGGRSILIRPHANVELLGCGIVRLRRVRVPDDPPSAIGGYGSETGYLHLEDEVACSRRLADCDVVDGKRGRSLPLQGLLRMSRRGPLDNQATACVTHVRRGDLIIRTGRADTIDRLNFVIVSRANIGG